MPPLGLPLHASGPPMKGEICKDICFTAAINYLTQKHREEMENRVEQNKVPFLRLRSGILTIERPDASADHLVRKGARVLYLSAGKF